MDISEGFPPTSMPPYLHKQLWIRVIVMVTCSLSISGACLIIMSFVCFKNLRSRGRQILTHISIMDLGAALFNLIGSAVYFDHYYQYKSIGNCTTNQRPIYHPLPLSPTYSPDDGAMCPQSLTVKYLCITQATLAVYFTLGSIFLSSCLSVYLYFRIVYFNSPIVKHVFHFSCIISYTLPLLLTVWLLLTGRLGYSPQESAGWCTTIFYDPSSNRRDLFASVFGYNLWIVLMFVIVPLLSLAVHAHVKKFKSKAIYRHSDKVTLQLQSIDYKFILIPFLFIGLRFWSLLADVLYLYANVGHEHISLWFRITLIILAGIGDSGQGFTNAIIFVFLTKNVREAFCHPCSKLKSKQIQIQQHSEESGLLDDSFDEETSSPNTPYGSLAH